MHVGFVMKKNKNQKMNWKNQGGFSLIQVMAVAAMVGVMGTIITKTVDNVSKTQRAVGQNASMRNLEETARRALLQSDSCVQTFTANPGTLQSTIGGGTQNFNSIRYGAASDPAKPAVLSAGQEYGRGAERVALMSITVENYQAGTLDAPANTQWGTIDIRMRFQKGSNAGARAANKHASSGIGGLTVDRVIRTVRVGFDATTTNIIRCSATSGDILAQACASLDGELIGGTCYNLKIRNIDAASAQAPINNDLVDYAIIAQGTTNGDGGGSIKAEGSVVVGSAAGNAVYNSDDTGSNANGSMFIERFLFVGDSPPDNTVANAMGGVGGVGGWGNDPGSVRTMDDVIVGATSTGLGNISSWHNLVAGGDGVLGNNTFIDQSANAVTFGDIGTAWTNANSVLRVQGGEAEFFTANLNGSGEDIMVGINDITGATFNMISISDTGKPRVELVPEGDNKNIVTYSPTIDGLRISELGGLEGIKLFKNAADNTLVTHYDLSGNYTGYNNSSGDQTHNNTNVRMRREWDGTFYIFGTGGGIDQSGDVRLIIAHGNEGDAYRPSYISYKMPFNSNLSGIIGTWNYEGSQIPNKDWAMAAIAHGLSDSGNFDNFLASISTGIEEDPMEEVKRQICISMKIDVDPTATVTWQRGVWTPDAGGDYCNMGFVAGGFVCGDAPGDPCLDHFSTDYVASGDLTTDAASAATFNGNAYFNDVVTFNAGFTIGEGAQLVMASDQKFKKKVKTLDNVLDKIDSFSGVNFHWKSNGKKDIGFIAQDIKKVYPELVTEKNGKNYVGYSQMNAVAIQAYKELREKNIGLKRDLASLKKAVCAEVPELPVCN